MKRIAASLILIALAMSLALGQNAPMLVGSGYGLPAQLSIAPGQIVTLQVTGLKTVLTSPSKATQMPLPSTLAGISVTLTQYLPIKTSLPVPLLGVSQRNFCSYSSSTSDCLITFVTVQIPFEVVFFENPFSTADPQCPASGGHCPKTELQVAENGTASKIFSVVPVGDSIHIITDCDVQAFSGTDFAVPFEFGISSGTYQTCQSIVTHADGTPVSVNSPVVPSEVVVLYAWGVGPTKPLAKTGEATSAPASPTWANDIQFNFSPNARPSKPYGGIFPFKFEFHPRYIGLVQDQIGLYSINVKLPDTFPPVQSCDGTRNGTYAIQSNLTITVGGINSFDGAAICAQTQQPAGVEQ